MAGAKRTPLPASTDFFFSEERLIADYMPVSTDDQFTYDYEISSRFFLNSVCACGFSQKKLHLTKALLYYSIKFYL